MLLHIVSTLLVRNFSDVNAFKAQQRPVLHFRILKDMQILRWESQPHDKRERERVMQFPLMISLSWFPWTKKSAKTKSFPTFLCACVGKPTCRDLRLAPGVTWCQPLPVYWYLSKDYFAFWGWGGGGSSAKNWNFEMPVYLYYSSANPCHKECCQNQN
jgi:hypothetical protein